MEFMLQHVNRASSARIGTISSFAGNYKDHDRLSASLLYLVPKFLGVVSKLPIGTTICGGQRIASHGRLQGVLYDPRVAGFQSHRDG